MGWNDGFLFPSSYDPDTIGARGTTVVCPLDGAQLYELQSQSFGTLPLIFQPTPYACFSCSTTYHNVSKKTLLATARQAVKEATYDLLVGRRASELRQEVIRMATKAGLLPVTREQLLKELDEVYQKSYLRKKARKRKTEKSKENL